jgi:RNA polymerase sigma-70 factor (ECF subfamily)
VCAHGAGAGSIVARNAAVVSLSRVRSVDPARALSEQVAQVYRDQSRRVLATLIRLLGDFDAAEEALQEAFQAAVEQWPRDGVPRNPRAWLVSVGRFRAIDALRRRGRDAAVLAAAARDYSEPSVDPDAFDDETIQDDQLRLIFTCCHPLLPQDARIALALREVCGLTTEEIARAFLVAPQAMKRRISRAKERIRAERIPYEVPSRTELGKRLETVLQVVYLVYNEGYVATAGQTLARRDLAEDALSLCRLLVDLLPEPEAIGLLALILMHESRRTARADAQGDVVPLEQQDRSLWDQERIGEGVGLVFRALESGRFGPYTLQAAIAAIHAAAPSVEATDWVQIVRLYDMVLEKAPSPVVAGSGAGPGRCAARQGRACGLPSRARRARGPQSEAGSFDGGGEVLSPRPRSGPAGARAPLSQETAGGNFRIIFFETVVPFAWSRTTT